MSYETRPKPKPRGVYLLPNLFTVAALFAGFYAAIMAMRGRFENAAIAIFIAMLLDSLDGRVARLTNTATPFGAELDSLSDMVSFGIAPALLIYSWSLKELGNLGWLVTFIFTVAVALRLARFNTQKVVNKRYFRGLPSPAAAAMITGLVWVGQNYGWVGSSWSYVVMPLTALAALAMVSNIPYRSFKDLDIKGHVPIIAIFFIALIFVLISLSPPVVLFAIFLYYGLMGPFTYLWHKRKRYVVRKRLRERKLQNDTNKTS